MKRILAILLTLCLVLGLAACGGGAASGAAEAGQLNLFTWEGVFPQSVLDGFTAETGYRVNYVSFDTDPCGSAGR